MKKILIIISLLVLCGCYGSTPTKEVENYFTKYQTKPEEMLNDIERIVDFSNYSDKQKEEQLNIIKNNYQNLEYIIKNEEVNANKAIVTVEINVYDYNKSLKEILEYRDNYIGEFMSDGYYDESKYIDYKIDKLKQVSDKIKYTLNIELTKIDNKWYIDDLSKEYLEKINGVYNY